MGCFMLGKKLALCRALCFIGCEVFLIIFHTNSRLQTILWEIIITFNAFATINHRYLMLELPEARLLFSAAIPTAAAHAYLQVPIT